jgi:FkbH-like protein
MPERERFADGFIARVRDLSERLSACGYQVLVFNLVDPGDGIFGHYAPKVAWSLTNQLRRCNTELTRLAAERSGFHVFDLLALQSAMGRATMYEGKLYYTAKFALTPAVLPTVAIELARQLLARKGSFLKVAILDLDNTLWGGVIGDDGLDRIQLGDLGLGLAFTAFQSWLKQLKDRGIVLAVCSKNEEANAREPFLKHPDMVLRLEDIAVFVANWTDKATNIRHIKSIIDVDYSSMIFLDDNPAERQWVRESFPTMTVPELPEDPTEYVSFLCGLNLFETASYTAQDAARTGDYQVEAQRRAEREKFGNLAEYLQSLEMRAAVRSFGPQNFPRVAQLIQRSNQFNLRTVRYTEEEVQALAASPDRVTLAFSLQDRFGDNGLIAAVILALSGDEAFIDTWLMSCRVLAREMEQFTLNTLAEQARQRGARFLVGEYLPTAKNGLVKDHYAKLGFAPDHTPDQAQAGSQRWRLDLSAYAAPSVPICLAPKNVETR